MEKFNPKPGWLDKQFKLAEQDIKQLPEWLRRKPNVQTLRQT